MKKVKYNNVFLKKVEIDSGTHKGCLGCYFNNPSKDGFTCLRPFDHMGKLSCTEEYEGDWIEDGDDPEDGYYETIETLYIWEAEKELSKLTRTI